MAVNQCKLLIIGDSRVGKSGFVFRYADDQYPGDTYTPTVGIDFKQKAINFEGKDISIQLWDTSGDARYRSITTAYYRGSAGMIIAFDITNEDSFTKVESFIELVEKTVDKEIPMILVGCKSDLSDKRVVTTDTAQEYADKKNMEYFEVSSKDGSNVQESVQALLRKIFSESATQEPTSAAAQEPISTPQEPKPIPQKPNPTPQEPNPTQQEPEPQNSTQNEPGLGSLLQQFKFPLIFLLAAVSIYAANKYFMKPQP